MKEPTNGLTVSEVARVLARLEHRKVSIGQVRSVLVLDTHGRALAPRQHGQTRLYSSIDVALVRLVLRLRAEGVSPTIARVLVAGLRDTLAKHWTHNDPMAFAVIGLRGFVMYATAARPALAVAWVPLRSVWADVAEAAMVVREREPEVWQWKRQSPAMIA